MKKMIRVLCMFLVAILILSAVSCNTAPTKKRDIDFENTIITDLEFILWYTENYDITIAKSNELQKLQAKAQNLLNNSIEDNTQMVSLESPIIGEDYWKITADVFNVNGYYVGELKDNKPHGFGVLLSPSGFIDYMGEFENGRFNGIGFDYEVVDGYNDISFSDYVYYYGEEAELYLKKRLNYCQYMGEFKNGMYHGKGTYFSYPSIEKEIEQMETTGLPYAHISVTVGDFKKDSPDGKYKMYVMGYLYLDANTSSAGTGEMTLYFSQSKQIEYKGGVKGYEYHGTGTLYDENGDVIYSGKWKNGDCK